MPSVRLRGWPGAGHTGQAAGHTAAPTLPSSLPLGDVQLTALPAEPGAPSLAASPPVRPRFQLSSPPPSPQSHQLPPPALGSLHPAGTGPRDGAACLPASVSEQMEDISSLLHPSTIICLARFLSGTPLLTASKSPVLACLFPDPSLITCLSGASIFPKAISPLTLDALKKDISSPTPMEECLGTKSPPSSANRHPLGSFS